MSIKRALCGLALLALSLPAGSHADSFTALASLSNPHVSLGQPVLASVEFAAPFTAITRLCFRFTFQGDLLDPGEGLTIVPVSVGIGPGFENVGSGPQDARTLCVLAPDPTIPPFLDGTEQIELAMFSGSVTIAELHVDIEGTRGTVPVRRRTWGVLKTLYR